MNVAFRDRDLVERLALAQRHFAEGPAEVAGELERDHLVHGQAAVVRDLHDDVGRREREGLRCGVPGDNQRRQRCS